MSKAGAHSPYYNRVRQEYDAWRPSERNMGNGERGRDREREWERDRDRNSQDAHAAVPNWTRHNSKSSYRGPSNGTSSIGQTLISPNSPRSSTPGSPPNDRITPNAPPQKQQTLPQKVDIPDLSTTSASSIGKETMDVLGTSVVDAITSLVTLHLQEDAAKQQLRERQIEYDKSKDHHLKFPNTKESQTAAKKQAERRLHEIQVQLDKEEESIKNIVGEALKDMIPGLLGQLDVKNIATKQELDQVKDKLAATEKANKDLGEKLEKNNSEMTKMMGMIRDLQNGFESHKNRLSSLNSDFDRKTEVVSVNTQRVEKILHDHVTSSASATKAVEGKVTSLAAQCEVLSTHAASLSKHDDKISDFERVLLGPKGLTHSVQLLVDQHQGLFESLKLKLDTTESGTTRAISSLQEGQQLTERNLNNCINDFASLRREFQRASDKNSSSQTRNSVTNDAITSLQSRMSSYESSLKSLQAKLKALDETCAAYITSETGHDLFEKALESTAIAEVPALSNRVAMIESKQEANLQHPVNEERLKLLESSINRLVKVEARILKIESQKVVSQDPALSKNTSALIANHEELRAQLNSLSAELIACRDGINYLKGQDETVDDRMSELVSNVVELSINEVCSQNEAIESRVAKVEKEVGEFSALPSKLENLQTTHSKELNEVRHEVGALSNKTAELVRNDLECRNRSVNRQNSADELSSTVHKDLRISIEGVQQKIHELTQENSALSNNTQNLEARLNNVSTNALATYMVDQALPRFGAIENRLTGFEVRSDRTFEAVKSLEVEIRDLKDPSSATNNYVREFQRLTSKRLSDLELTSGHTSRLVDELQVKVQGLHESEKLPKEAVDSIRKEFAELKALIEASGSTIESARSQMKADADLATTKVDDVSHKFDLLKTSVEEAAIEVKNTNKQTRLNRDTLAARVENLSTQIDILERERPKIANDLAARIDTVSSTTNTVSERVTHIAARIGVLESNYLISESDMSTERSDLTASTRTDSATTSLPKVTHSRTKNSAATSKLTPGSATTTSRTSFTNGDVHKKRKHTTTAPIKVSRSPPPKRSRVLQRRSGVDSDDADLPQHNIENDDDDDSDVQIISHTTNGRRIS